ncbi:MAG TPA: energy transducer TonB [Blastocatellia bacterium]|nr:energy transducer TonB [Blastocatellia bacterium]
MANLKVILIANAFSIWIICQAAGQMTVRMTGAPQIESFEKQALSSVQEMSASELDAKLAGGRFSIWFNQIIGPNAGVVWQLTECGERIGSPNERGSDLPACAEINAKLPDGRRVFVAINVGTFKKGLKGKPVFFGAAIEQNLQLYPVRRLSDLPEMLRDPDKVSNNLPATNTNNRIVNPPTIIAAPTPLRVPIQDAYLLSLPTIIQPSADDLSPPPPPPPAQVLPPLPQEPEMVSESDLQSRVITRVKPVYSPDAKKINATGTVKVEITIAEDGMVVEAKAISGHFALRSAAVEAARHWVFEPANLNGAPLKTKGVLTFIFAPSAK